MAVRAQSFGQAFDCSTSMLTTTARTGTIAKAASRRARHLATENHISPSSFAGRETAREDSGFTPLLSHPARHPARPGGKHPVLRAYPRTKNGARRPRSHIHPVNAGLEVVANTHCEEVIHDSKVICFKAKSFRVLVDCNDSVTVTYS